jgi:ubiquitin carboxyl-terminal hydrolase L3
MTIFWLFQIRLAILSFQADTNSSILPSSEDFGYVLLRSPQLMDSGLWKPYYTKDLLFSPEAREAWYPPNRESLPAILAAAAAPSNSYKLAPPTVELDRLLRFGFEVSREIMASTGRRSEVINKALEDLKTATIRLRASDPRVPPYSLTQAYFWIQLFHHAQKSVEEARSTTLKDLPVPVSDLGFPVLKVAMGIRLDEWRAYYSSSLWESIPARMEFAVPDLKPLPSTTVVVNAEAAKEMLKVEMDRASREKEEISEKE